MVLLALPPPDHLLIERDRGQFVPSRRRRVMANVRAERLLKTRQNPAPRCASRRCSSNASSLHGRNSARILGIRATFQRDNSTFLSSNLTCPASQSGLCAGVDEMAFLPDPRCKRSNIWSRQRFPASRPTSRRRGFSVHWRYSVRLRHVQKAARHSTSPASRVGGNGQ